MHRADVPFLLVVGARVRDTRVLRPANVRVVVVDLMIAGLSVLIVTVVLVVPVARGPLARLQGRRLGDHDPRRGGILDAAVSELDGGGFHDSTGGARGSTENEGAPKKRSSALQNAHRGYWALEGLP